MKQFLIIYEENKKLDKLFDEHYNVKDEETIKKNKLELLVELGELANETKCFKYWSKRQGNLENIKEEFADCLLMVLLFCNMLDIDLNDYFPTIEEKDIIIQFNTLFYLSSTLMENFKEETIKLILSNLINLGYLLGLTNDDIISSSLAKINKNFKRFKEGF